MKKLFLSLVALTMATMSYAQNMLVATLSHGDDVSMYYGTFALQDAVNAAASGDVINLSGGTFQAANISKNITLRGTGVDVANCTNIIGDFTINISSTDSCLLSMEGILTSNNTIFMKGTYNKAYFLKCYFMSHFYFDNNSQIINMSFVNCSVSYASHIFHLKGKGSIQFVNCSVANFQNESETTSAALFSNCVIHPSEGGERPDLIRNSQLVNTIIWGARNDSDKSLPSSSFAINCVSANYINLFRNSGNTNCYSSTTSDVFKDLEDWSYELTDDAKTRYIGTDGTEVGQYGGMMPYNLTPLYPRITKMNVANKTTADGKLSVEIEVSATE